MVILGLDLSINSTGYYITTDNYKYIHSGTLKNKTLLEQYNIIKQLIPDYNVTDVAIEDIFYSRNIKTVKQLAQLHGAVLIALEELNIKYKYYSVMSAKKYALGKIVTKDSNGKRKTGNDYKLEVQEVMEKIFKHNFNNELDISDASSLCYSFLKELKNI